MFGNALGFALSPLLKASSTIERFSHIRLDTFFKSVSMAVSGYLYMDTFNTYYETEDDFYYANARAAGRVLKYTIPFIFLPTFRMLNSELNKLRYWDIFTKQVDRFSYHKFIAKQR
ncbi:hypothetical protein [Legionella shakespearei]|uniref:Uncharacterized protein n=1 Tax=Legionella shakespearei DSM 23087 TaxID=1122169 RepID=A0A0W0YL49_9GAMM|nr:hypothetical protein [Legionella shakespearei]KTD57626.1 hypothetical protein Lsha_2467 [Legionella shakespearei DSM 23087]